MKIVVLIMLNILEKELKSGTGGLLRADLTGHGHFTLFGRWAWMAVPRPCPVSHQKDTPALQDFNFFPIMFYYIIVV